MLTLALVSAAPLLHAQSQSRVATTRTLLMQHPLFFHTRSIAITDTPRLENGVWKLTVAAGKTLAIVFKSAPATDKAVEIRGTFVDVGRFAPDDSRITAYSLQPVVQAVVGPNGAWPQRETLFAIVGATTAPAEDASTSAIRSIAMSPEKFDGKPLTLRGRFRGRNLTGDLPTWPRQADSDFVLQAGDGALWVTGIKPKGKGFDLDTQNRRDLGRWLEVSGSLTIIDGLPVLRANTIAQSSPDEEPVPEERPLAPPMPPPTINFSAPTEGETDIAPATPIRVQFSRDMKAESFEGHVKVTATAAGTAQTVPPFTTTYKAANLAMEIRFAEPLPKYATVVVEFLEGIVTPDGTALAPAKIRFSTGG